MLFACLRRAVSVLGLPSTHALAHPMPGNNRAFFITIIIIIIVIII